MRRLVSGTVLFAIAMALIHPVPGAEQTNTSFWRKVVGVPTADPVKKRIPGNMRFSQYTGFDSFLWETSIGALADTSYKLPVYRSWPSRRYVVIGDVRHEDPRKEWHEGELRDAVKAAQILGGEAVIIRHGSEAGVQALTGLSDNRRFYSQPEQTALVIRWQTEDEIQTQLKRERALVERLKKEEPAFESSLDSSEQTASLAIKYLLRSGTKDDSPEFFSKFLALMKSIDRKSDGLSGQWLFKAILKSGGITTQSDRDFVGIASVQVEGDNVAIISVRGDTEANFSGKQSGGGLTGQIGIGGYSSKAVGVAVPRKISITFQSTTQSGTLQGTLILQR